jgi:hypothetical protein
VVGDELEATHQFVSPAKYLAAARRISRLGDELGPLRSQRGVLGLESGQALLRGLRLIGRGARRL